MRDAFVAALVAEAERNPSIVLLTGDLGFMALEPFSERFPDRFFNCGVAEQNMVGLATGLAESGLRPFAYSIATFASMRPYEFLRNGGLLHELPVCVVGIGGGVDYGLNGASHHAIEDVALMRTHPELNVFVPADSAQASAAVAAAARLPGPAYLRLEKRHQTIPELAVADPGSRAVAVGSGRDVAFVTMGGVVGEALAASALLADQGVEATVVAVSGFNPSPVQDLAEVLAEVPVAITVEAHMINGALGSFVCETVAETGLSTRVHRCGLRTIPRGQVGTREYMLAQHGLDPSSLAETALRARAVLS
jgi:transketolase